MMYKRIEGNGGDGYVGKNEQLLGNEDTLDLGLAASPIGYSESLRTVFAEGLQENLLTKYNGVDVYNRIPAGLLIESMGLVGVAPEQIVFNGNGAYGAGDEVVRFLAKQGVGRVLVPNYSFPNVAEWTNRHGVDHSPVNTKQLSPKASMQKMARMDRGWLEGAAVYVDFPNNPFGWADLNLLADVVTNVSNNGGVPFVDLAFGEVLGEEYEVAVNMTLERGGVVTGSLSKTQGLPDMRVGYMIWSDRFAGEYESEKLVFGLPGISRKVLGHLFDRNGANSPAAKEHARAVADYCAQTNPVLYEGLRNLGLEVGETDIRVPVQVVIARDMSDFCDRLHGVGKVAVESLDHYSVTIANGEVGYGNSAARVLTPGPGMLNEALNRFEQVVKSK